MSASKMLVNGKKTGNLGLKVILLLGLFILAYWVPLKGIAHEWFHNEDYSYGVIIPFAAAYLLWEKRNTLSKIAIGSSWKTLPFLVGLVLLSIYAILGSSGNISRPVVPFLIILFVVFCFGMDLARHLTLPLGFLIFMVPLPNVLDRTLGVFLKSVSSRLGGDFIRLFGIPVHVSGNVIDLGVNQLQVVDACSGIRFLFPLVALGILYAHFFVQKNWKKWACVLATFPIAVLTNCLRIGITGILTNVYGAGVAEGFFHAFSGWAIFMVSLVLLFLFDRALRFFPSRAEETKKLPGTNTRGSGFGEPEHANIDKAYFVSVGLLLLVATLSLSTKVLPAVKVQGGIGSFPSAFFGWQGRPEVVEPEIIKLSGAEEAFNGVFRNDNGEEVALYLGYRGSAFLENENFFHSPTVCLPAQGLEVSKTKTRQIDGIPRFGTIRVTEMAVNSAGSSQLVYFWFQTKDKVTHDKDINRFHLALHAIGRNNTHDIFARQMTPIRSNEKVEDAEKRMDRFAREMMETLLAFLKEKQVMGAK